MSAAKLRTSDLDVTRADEISAQVISNIDSDPHRDRWTEITAYMAQLRKYPALRDQDEYNLLFRQFREGETHDARRRARDALVYGNMRLVLSVGMRMTGRGLDLLDLLQEGVFGLLRAIEKYDPSLGFRFSTYAHAWIRQTMGRAIADNNTHRPYRLPVHIQERVSSVRRAMSEFLKTNGRWPEVLELYQTVKLQETDVARTTKLGHVAICRRLILEGYLPLEGPVPGSDDEDSVTNAEIHGEPPRTEALVDAKRMLEQFCKALERVEQEIDTLPARDAMILRLRFGLGEFDPLTLEEIGERYDITRERVRQIEAKALQVLNERLQVTADQLRGIVAAVDELAKIVASV